MMGSEEGAHTAFLKGQWKLLYSMYLKPISPTRW